MRGRIVAALVVTASAAAAATPAIFRSAEWGVSFTYPAGLVRSAEFKTNYFDRGAWRVSFAADTGPGTKIVALSLPDLHAKDAGGESTATAELRIGASRDPEVLATCLTYGMHSGNDVESTTRTIGGVRFSEVPDNNDAEMMKTIRSDDFRAFHDGACWAIDLVAFVGGTASKPPEFSPAQLTQLRDVLDTIRFER